MARSRMTLLGGALLGVSLVAAGCGGGSGGSETSGTVDANVKEGVKSALESTTVAGGATATTAKPRPTTMADWEKLWETERAAVVKKLKDAGAGKSADGKTVKGTSGFTMDLSKCPDRKSTRLNSSHT